MLFMAWPLNIYAFFLTGSYLITRLHFSIYNKINLSNLLRFSIFLGSFPEPDVGLPKLGKTIFTFLFWYRIFTHSVFLGVADFYKLYKSAQKCIFFQFFVYFVGGFWSTHLNIFLLIFKNFFITFFWIFFGIFFHFGCTLGSTPN